MTDPKVKNPGTQDPKRRRRFLQVGTALGTGLVLAGSRMLDGNIALAGQAGEDAAGAEPMGALEAIRGRRSVRKFLPDPVPQEDIKSIIQAACLAPTSGNQQPWKFLVVRERASIDRLKTACIAHRLERARERAEGEPTAEQLEYQRTSAEAYFTDYLSAPVYVVVLTSSKSRYPDYNHHDGPLAVANLMIAARALGYGTVFCTDSIPEEITREVFNIPEHLTRICITPIGVPAEWPRKPGKKPWRAFVQKETF